MSFPTNLVLATPTFDGRKVVQVGTTTHIHRYGKQSSKPGTQPAIASLNFVRGTISGKPVLGCSQRLLLPSSLLSWAASH